MIQRKIQPKRELSPKMLNPFLGRAVEAIGAVCVF
jgi:hypothetical protein